MKISLDLLPQNKKDEVRRGKLFREILHEEVLFIFPLLVLIVILISVFYLLKIQRDANNLTYETQQKQSQYQELNKYDKAFKEINAASSFLIKIEGGHLHWANILNHLSWVIPNGIIVDNFASKNYNIYLTGRAAKRDQLLELKRNLENSACFKDINVPLSDFVVKENVNFQMDFVVSQDCLLKRQ